MLFVTHELPGEFPRNAASQGTGADGANSLRLRRRAEAQLGIKPGHPTPGPCLNYCTGISSYCASNRNCRAKLSGQIVIAAAELSQLWNYCSPLLSPTNLESLLPLPPSQCSTLPHSSLCLVGKRA